MAGFAESYYRDGGTISKMTSSMWTSGHYYINPEMRARRIVNISHYAGVDFCKVIEISIIIYYLSKCLI